MDFFLISATVCSKYHVNVDEEMVIVLMNKQTLVTSCPIHMFARKDSLQFEGPQHSEKKKKKYRYCFQTQLLQQQGSKTLSHITFAVHADCVEQKS